VHVVASDQTGPTPSAPPTTIPDADSGQTRPTPWLLALVVLGLAIAGAVLWWRLRRRS
jgi:hypothetical protein